MNGLKTKYGIDFISTTVLLIGTFLSVKVQIGKIGFRRLGKGREI